MNSSRLKFRFITTFITFLLAAFTQQLLYAQSDEIARLDSSDGIVEAKFFGENEFKKIEPGTIFKKDDTVRTTKNGRASILFSSGTILRMAPGTSIQFQSNPGDDSSSNKLSMNTGKAHFFDREPTQFPEVNSPAVTTAVRGTEFTIEVNPLNTSVAILNGTVECFNNLGRAQGGGNEIITTKIGEAPIKGILVDPIDKVQWTLFYPRILDVETSDNTSLQLKKAQENLEIGQVEQATMILNDLEKSVSKTKNQNKTLSLINAQRAIISTVKNQKDLATIEAEQSWKLDQNEYSAIANAYVMQAQSNLDEADKWLTIALERNPKNALALTRKAELALGAGEIDEASKLAKQALEISPTDAYAMNVYAFSVLILDRREEALDYFKEALKIAPSSGLSHLGYGLALIKDNYLEDGRKEIEKAVSLEPNVAIYRSYLGKAYFEEDREHLAISEYEQAIKLDSQDPTPYLYRAFSQLAVNKPISALQDIEKSIELNDNRAVYRSSLLLDQDLGTKSAGLAEVFNNLGFTQAARVEAIKSINKNYSNYSGHRLLSDSYNSIFLNDAGLSESKITNLLAPLSFNLYSQGSNISSFNEYNSLFDRDLTELEIGTQYETENHLLLPEAIASGKNGKFGYLFSFDGLYTDDPGVDNDSERQRGRTVLQYQPNYDDIFLVDSSILYRKAVNDREFIDDVNVDDYEVDLGYRHSFSSHSNLLFSSSLSDQHYRYISHGAEREILLTQLFEGQSNTFNDFLIVDDSSYENLSSIRNTIQWIYDIEAASFIVGTQVYAANADREERSPVIEDQEEVFNDINYNLQSSGFNQLDSVDLYSYNTFHLNDWADLSAGAAYTEVEIEEREVTPFVENTYNKSHLSPKAGLTLYPSDALTLRSAYFETLRKSSLEDQASLEPTLVGGLNQRFTDLSGSFGRTFGLAADYKAAASTYLGVEGFNRHVVEDNNNAISSVELNYDSATAKNDVILLDPAQLHQDQNIIRAYINQVLTDRLVANFSSEWSRFEYTDPELPFDNDLDKYGIGVKYFDPYGWYFGAQTIQRHQSVKESGFSENGADTFWLTDLALGYRLDDRRGFVELRFNNIFDEDFNYDQSLGLEEFVYDSFNFIAAFRYRF